MPIEQLNWVNVFIPESVTDISDAGYLFGHYERTSNVGLNINITAFHTDFRRFHHLQYVGQLIMDNDGRSLKDDNILNANPVQICLNRLSGLSLQLDWLRIAGKTFPSVNHHKVSVVFYDPSELMKSQSFDLRFPGNKIEFLNFLLKSLNETAKELITIVDYRNGHRHCRFFIPEHLSVTFQNHFQTSLEEDNKMANSKFELNNEQMIYGSPKLIAWIYRLIEFLDILTLRKSIFIALLKFRLLQYRLLWQLWTNPTTKHSLKLWNLLSSIGFDHLLGVLVTILVFQYTTPTFLFDLVNVTVGSLVNKIYHLLTLLQSMPAGLKLNQPFNEALSQVMFYHIYLWRNYMVIVQSLFPIMMVFTCYFGVFGLTFTISLLSDLFSLVTIHIYCFYGYTSIVYSFIVSGIISLWRLFRGKKYNPLRDRIDSYSYENVHLFIGTIFFTVFIFLLPTALMYYVVFLTFRIITLAAKGFLYFFIELLSTLPVYSFVLWLTNSYLISSRIYFRPAEQNDNDDGKNPPIIMFHLKTLPSSLDQIFTQRHDPVAGALKQFLIKSRHVPFEWNAFLCDIIRGWVIGQNLPHWFSFSLLAAAGVLATFHHNFW